jgi:hypothetical protein
VTLLHWVQVEGKVVATADVFTENPPSVPMLLFPSRIRKYVRLSGPQAHESINGLVVEVPGSRVASSDRETLTTKMRLDGVFGASATIKIASEGEVSALDVAFSYWKVMAISFVIGTVIILSGLLVFRNTLTVVGFALVIPLLFHASNTAVEFLDVLNKTMPFIEKEIVQKALEADRERWRATPKDTKNLYRRLSEKHVRTWGNTKVLEYKIAEYKVQGLTRDEAVRKAAEEEGVE